MNNDTKCRQCGAPIKSATRFCEQCGARLEMVAPEALLSSPSQVTENASQASEPKAASAGGSTAGEAITWEYAMPILTNAFMWWDMGRVIVISLISMYALVAIMGLIVEGELVLLPPELLLIIGGIFVVLFGIAGLVVLWNHFHMQFTVDTDGVVSVTGRRERRINRITTAVGALALLSGRPGPLGAALIATSQEVTGIRWRDVHKITVHQHLRVISLSDSWHTVQRLYCTPENFGPVVARVQAELAAAQQWRAAHPTKARPFSYLPLLIWGVLAVAAAIATTAWEGEEIAVFAFIAMVFVILAGLAAGTAQRVFSVFGLAVIAFYLFGLVSFAAEVHKSSFGLTSWRGYESDTELFVVAACGGGLLALMTLWRLAGPSDGWPSRWTRGGTRGDTRGGTR